MKSRREKKAPGGKQPVPVAELVQTTVASQKPLWWPGVLKHSDAAGGMNPGSGFVMEKIQAEKMILASSRTLQIKAGDIQKSYVKHTENLNG